MNAAEWWRSAVIYQIYPRSFADSNGDGIGDLPGIEAHLDYLVHLGIDAIWLSPFYPSPMADFGYDVRDYCNVDPLFGTLADFDALIAAARERGLKTIVDFVPNHTSDEHPWFVASRSSRANPKREWYLWRDPESDGGPPNNWLARFGGPSWTSDPRTDQYYLHSFLPQQPDLNWRNAEVRTAMYDAMRFWLERGVDGFRLDALWLLVKDERFRDDPPNADFRAGMAENERVIPVYSADRPEMHEIVAEMRAVAEEFDGDRLLIGEIYLPFERLVTYYGAGLRGAQMPFNFSLLLAAWNAQTLAETIRAYVAAIPEGAWPNYVLGNHDNSRVATRIGAAQARVAAMLLLTLRGTPTIYYGDELGMLDVAIPPDRVRDPAELRQPGIGMGRDPERAPMPWNDAPGRGFTTGVPWLPFGDAATNVAALSALPGSMLGLYRALLELRRAHPALKSGSLADVRADGDILAYRRRAASEEVLVLLNLGSNTVDVAAPPAQLLLSTRDNRGPERVAEMVDLHANEGVVLLLSSVTA